MQTLRRTTLLRRATRIGCIAGASVALAHFLQFHELERLAQNLRQNIIIAVNSVGGQPDVKKIRDQIVVLTLSDETMASLGETAPLPRHYHTRVIRELTRAGAKLIAFDMLFAVSHPDDKELAAAMRASGRVILGCRFENYGTPQQVFIGPTTQLSQACLSLGHIAFPQDPQSSQVSQLEPVLFRSKARLEAVPALSLAAAKVMWGQPTAPEEKVKMGWRVGEKVIPLDEETDRLFQLHFQRKDSAQINLHNPDVVEEKFSFIQVPFEDVLNGVVEDPFYGPTQFFKDKIVLVGNTTALAHDVLVTPIGLLPGVEVHGHALTTLLEGNYWRTAPRSWQWCALLVPTLLLAAVGIWGGLRWIAPVSLGLLALYWGGSVWWMMHSGFGLQLVTPAAALFFSTVGVLVERGIIEEQEKRRTTALLERHLSPQIAGYVLQNRKRQTPPVPPISVATDTLPHKP